MKKLIKAAALILLSQPLLATADIRDDAQALTAKAATYVEQNGIDAARQAFQQKGGEYYPSGLYVFVQDMDGKTLIHAANPKLDGKVLIKMKDPKGVYFIKDMVEIAKTEGSGWINYMWKNPETAKLAAKVTYVQKIDGMDAFVGSGYFQ